MDQNVKIGILWEPEKLCQDIEYFSFLTVTKKANLPPSYRQGKLDMDNIKKLEAGFSEMYVSFLERISFEENQRFLRAVAVQKKKAGGTLSIEALLQASVEQHKFDQVTIFSTKSNVLPLYHQIVHPETQRLTVEACRFKAEVPQLHFEVRKQTQHYTVDAFISFEGQSRPLREFGRYEFMIHAGKDWYQMTLKDNRTLNWLKTVLEVPENRLPANFTEKVLLRLEKDYKVDRKGFFQVQEIRVLPKCSIYLSELNDAFLVWMPRWSYENFTMEGQWTESQQLLHKGIEYRIYRDKEAETEFTSFVHDLHPSFPGQLKRGFYYLPFADARKKQWFVKTYRALLERDVDITGLDKLKHFRYSPFEAETEVSVVRQTAVMIVLNISVVFGKEAVPLLNIQKMLLAGQHNVLLKDDSIAVFTEQWQQSYALFFKHGVIEKNHLTLPPWIFLGRGKQQDSQNSSFQGGIIPDSWRSQWLAWQSEAPLFAVPSTVQAVLRPYQQKGFEWMVLLSQIQAGACLADDMGLGKTLQTICFLAWNWANNPGSRCIVICPSSLIYNWDQEIKKYIPSIQTYLYNGGTRNWADFVEGNFPLMITSYSMLRQHLDAMKAFPWQVAVVDESHNIKNPAAQITRAVYELNALHRVALSGTPVMNNTFDLFAQIQFLLPGLLGNSSFFKKEYVIPIDRDADKDKIEALRQLTSPFILRRTKKQVAADLPEKTESILWCEMGAEQQLFYEEAKSLIKDSLFLGIKNDGLERSKLGILQGLQRLRQICDAPQLIGDHEQFQCNASVKADRLMENLIRLQQEGNKALVFSQFTGMLDLIANRCDSEGIVYYHFDGSTPVIERHSMVSAFQQEQDPATVFLISLKAGNAGLNLTAAQYVYLVDPWWNQAVEQQAIDRTHRIGQSDNVFAYRMICKHTIEEKILAMQQKKKHLSDELISAEEGFVKQMTEDDLRFLFS